MRGFRISLRTARDVYLDGESFPLEVVTTDAQGEPSGQVLSATVVKQIVAAGQVTERDVEKKTLETDSKSGRGTLTFRIDDPQGGRYVLRIAGTDRFGNPIIADRALSVSGKDDPTKLRLLADRQRYKVGEEAAVRLHSRARAGTALLAWEADRILTYKIVTLNEGDNAVAWAIEGSQFPNFTLTATRMWKSELDAAKLDVDVERDLRVTIAAAKPVVGPGEPIELEVTTVDQLGRPVAAELSIAMVDQSLLRLFHDSLPEIGPFFYNQTRTGAFATEATNTFRYEPQTAPVNLAVVEEAELAAAAQANAADRVRVVQEAQNQALAQTAPAPQSFFAAGGAAAPASRPMERAGELKGGPRREIYAAQSEEGLRREIEDLAVGKSLSDKKAYSLGLSFQTRRAGDGGQLEAAKNARIESRERFVETAYWNPHVVTDKAGKARLTFKAPAALSEYRLTARGITRADSLAGQTIASVTVRKSFFVDLKVPVALNQGDKPRFVGEVHHSGVRGKVAIRLAIYTGGRDEVYPKTLELTQDGVDQVIFDAYEVPEGDTARLTLTAAVGDLSDELVVEVPVRPWGVPVIASESGTSNKNATVFIGLPAGRAYESPEMEIVLAPTLKRMLIELALGHDAYVLPRTSNAQTSSGSSLRPSRRRIMPPTCSRRRRRFSIFATRRHRPRPKPSGSGSASRGWSRPWSRPRTPTAAGPGSRVVPCPSVRASAAAAFQRPADVGRRRLGAGLGRAARAPDRRQDSRSGDRTPPTGILQAACQRSRNTRGPAPCLELASSGRLRGGQHFESSPNHAFRLGSGLPRAHVRQPGPLVAGARAFDHPGPARQERADRSRSPCASTGTTPAIRRRSGAPSIRRPWSRWRLRAACPRLPSSQGLSSGSWRTVPVMAGSRTKPRARRRPRSRLSTAALRQAKTDTA